MFDQYTQQPTDVFMQNPLIQFIQNDNQWTISNKDKEPVDAVHLLERQLVRNARVLDDPYPLVSLTRLNNDENLAYTNRAYRLQAQHNRIFVVDVEPSASPELLKFAVEFPAHYTEISRNGGVHLLIKIPENMITPENEYLLTTTVVKSQAKDADLEVILNDHYITFTKKMVMDKEIADFVNNQHDRERLSKFLTNIVKMDEKAKLDRELKRKLAVNFDDSNVQKELVEELANSMPFVKFINKQKENKSPEDFNNDMSRYEASVSTSCAGYTRYYMKKVLPGTQVLQRKFKDMTDNDWIYLAYKLTEFIVDERDKHNEIRGGLPWLLYLAQGGWTFILASEEKEKNNKKT